MNNCFVVALFLLSVIPFFFSVNHYNGLVMDGPLYMLQVINSMHPERFVGDIAFAYGNQDSFSLFTPIYKLFIVHFGVEAGSRYLCFILQAFFAIAWAMCVKVFWDKYCREKFCHDILYKACAGLKQDSFLRKVCSFLTCNEVSFPIGLCLLCMGIYAFGMPLSQLDFVRMVESYAVARLASVAFGVAGLGLLLVQRKFFSLAFFVLGFLMHPLMAGWGIPLWLFVCYPGTIKWILAVSIMVPFSIFWGRAPFASYPDGWLNRPLNYAPSYDDIVRFIAYISFFGTIAQRKILNSFLSKISGAIAVLVGIALYWWVWGGFAQHIFLYQVQCFRVEWICQILTLPVFVLIIIERIRIDRCRYCFSSYDVALVSFALALFLPVHLIGFIVLGTILLLLKDRPAKVQLVQWVLLAVCFLAFFYQTYLHSILEGAPHLLLRNLKEAFKVVDTLVLAECILSISVSIYMFRRKKHVHAAMFAFFCAFPKFMLLPLLSCLAWLKPMQRRMKWWLFIAFAAIAIVEGLLNGDGRVSHMPLPGPFAIVCVLWSFFVICYVVFANMSLLHMKFIKKWGASILFACGCSVYACIHWDAREEESILSEKQMDYFVNYDIFEKHSEIVDRGRVFYYVKGTAVAMPRLQFLNGGYYDENSLMGAVFFEGQYHEGNRRRNNLLLKQDFGESSVYAKYRIFSSTALSVKDSLVDRIDYLCNKGEITYIVSDENLPNTLLDSLSLEILEKEVYLYRCSEKKER